MKRVLVKIYSYFIGFFLGIFDFLLIIAEMVKPKNEDIRKIAYRNLFRNKRRTIIISMSIIGAMFGLSIMSGWSLGLVYEMKQSVIKGGLAHVQIYNKNYRNDPGLKHKIENSDSIISQIKNINGIDIVTSRSTIEGMINCSGNSMGLLIMGIEPELEGEISYIGENMLEGCLNDLNKKHSIILSKRTAEKLNVKVGKKVIIMVTNLKGEIEMASAKLRGIFHTGMRNYDAAFAFVNNSFFAQIFGMEKAVTSIAITVNDFTTPERIKSSVGNLNLKNIEVVTWLDIAPQMMKQMSQMETMLYVFYSIFFIAMCFGLINTMLMAIYERRQELGVLQAIGMSAQKIKAMIMLEVFLLTAISGLLGTIIGICFIKIFLPDGLDLSTFSSALDLFGISTRIPFKFTLSAIFIPLCSSIFFGMLAGFYPARSASKMNPVESIRAI